MKKIFLLAIVLSSVLISCSSDGPRTVLTEVTIAIPVTETIANLRASISVEDPKEINESGKIYAYQNYVLINDLNRGIHVIDNSYPSQPVKIAYINIPGNIDMAIKGNILYADSWLDLFVFDFSNPLDIRLINRLEDVLPRRSLRFDLEENVFTADYANFNPDNEIIVDWEYEIQEREVTFYPDSQDDIAVAESAPTNGTGGSLARFNIVGNYLYAVQQDFLFSFDISSLDSPVKMGEEYVGWDIETLFSDGDYLYIGSVDGMYIYGLDNPSSPNYLSNVNHLRGCDPVVVQDDYAYVTIRGGNTCGQTLSQLDIINVANRSNPNIELSIQMQEPYGLGVKGDRLYVSDGSNGLVIFNISNSYETFELIRYSDLFIYDVIPQEELLLMVGENKFFNYEYTDEGIGLIASFSLN